MFDNENYVCSCTCITVMKQDHVNCCFLNIMIAIGLLLYIGVLTHSFTYKLC